MVKNLHCSPKFNKNSNFTCFTLDALERIAQKYNEKNPDKIKLSKNKRVLWNRIRSKLSNKCNTEWCWLDQDFANNSLKKLKKNVFRPKMPSSWKKNKYEWLSTTDINVVMKQYEKEYPNFRFIGPVPVDCYIGSNLSCELTNLDIVKTFKKINKLGIIYNLDYSYQSGSHWVGLFVDGVKEHIVYFDSVGTPPPEEIKYLMEKIKSEFKKEGKDYKIIISKKSHQYGNTECGIYSMNFIIQMLKGKTLGKLNQKRIPDKVMNEMRKYLYRSN